MNWMRYNNWVGKTILSQYGLLCEVLEVNDGKIVCLAFHNKKIWKWDIHTVSLITKNNEILGENGEIYGNVTNKNYELYPEEQRHFLNQEEIDQEFQ